MKAPVYEAPIEELDRVIEAESELTAETAHETAGEIPGWLLAATRAVSICIGLGLPLLFGGVHAQAYLAAYAAVFLLMALHLLVARAQVLALFAGGPACAVSARVFRWLLIFGAVLALQYVFLSAHRTPHPVAGASGGVNFHLFHTALQSFLFFFAVLVIARLHLQASRRTASRIEKLAVIAAVIVSLTALSHWFYDNGRLFWTFEPENVFVSSRARWPFVNSNNLAHFLLPFLFLLMGLLATHRFAASELRRSRSTGRSRSLAALLGSKRMQRTLTRASFTFTFLLAVLLAVIASLSRSAFLGTSLGSLVFLFAMRSIRRKMTSGLTPPPDGLPRGARTERGRRRIHRQGNEKRSSYAALEMFLENFSARLSRYSGILLVLLACSMLYFFLHGRGAELLENRIEYGLLHSKDDLRWQIYGDTLPLISDHLWLGVGFGNWSQFYPRYMNPLLSGINPQYLASEPLQLLAETGLAGLLPMLCLVFVLAGGCLGALKSAPPRDASVVAGLLSGMVSIMVGAVFDFPFRMPATMAWCGMLVALTLFYADKGAHTSSPPGEVQKSEAFGKPLESDC